MFLQRLLKPVYAPPPQPAPPVPDNSVIDTLARTLWGEARGENLAGQEAVASVILNRVAVAHRHGGAYWWGHDIITVCRKPFQFSCWNADDPNRTKLEQVKGDDKIFAQCLRIARRAVAGTLTDRTTHYHTDTIRPSWARGRTPLAVIGRHLFYRITE